MKFLKNMVIILFITACMIWGVEVVLRTFVINKETKMVVKGPINSQKYERYYTLPKNAEWRVKTFEYDVVYKTNAEGLRDHSVYIDKPRSKEIKRVLLIGDSFSYGYANNFEDSWAYLLEKKLNNTEIIKAGVPGFDQYKQYYYLKSIIEKYSPDVVMLGFLPNDIFMNQELKKSLNLSNITQKDKHQTFNLKEQLTKSAIFTILIRKLLSNDQFYIKSYLKTIRNEFFKSKSKQNIKVKKQIAITKQLLDEINRLCKKNNAKLVVVSIPQRIQRLLTIMPQANYDPYAIDHEFFNFAKEKDFVWLSTLELISKTSEEPFYIFDGHLNKHGNKILADICFQNRDELSITTDN